MGDARDRVGPAVVVGGLLLGVVVLGGVATAHGSYGVEVLGPPEAGAGVTQTYTLIVSAAGPDSSPGLESGDGPLDLTVTLSVDGETVETRTTQIGFLKSKNLEVDHRFSAAGNHTVTATAEYSSGDWTWTETSTMNVTVAPSRSALALEQCLVRARKGLGSPYKVGCHSRHGGGLVSGVLSYSPAVLGGVLVGLIGLVAVAAAATGRWDGFDALR